MVQGAAKSCKPGTRKTEQEVRDAAARPRNDTDGPGYRVPGRLRRKLPAESKGAVGKRAGLFLQPYETHLEPAFERVPTDNVSEVIRDDVDRKSTRLNSSHSQISYA